MLWTWTGRRRGEDDWTIRCVTHQIVDASQSPASNMMGLQHRSSRFDMFGPSLKRVDFAAVEERIESSSVREGALRGWRRILRPTSLGCLGLALAILVWGYSYRLSRYSVHQDTASRALTAKLWVDQRDHAEIGLVHTGARVDRQGSSGTPDAPPQQLFTFVLPSTPSARPAFIQHACFTPLLPFRSPPSDSFSA